MSTNIPTFLELGGEVKILLRHPNDRETSWSATNPSIARGPDGKLLMAVRSSNYLIDNDNRMRITAGNRIHSRVWMCDVDPDALEANNMREIGIFGKFLSRGVEDPRLFWRDAGWTFSGVLLHKPDVMYARLGTFRLLPEKKEAQMIRLLPGPVDDKPEKNWMAPDVATDKFEFNYSPTQVFKDGKVVGDSSKDSPPVRGGSGLVLQEDGTYLAVVHATVENSYKTMDASGLFYKGIYLRDYTHYFARYSAEGILTHLSPGFIFKRPGIEFAAGMVEHGDDLIISYGARDVYACIARIPKKKALELLAPIS